MLCAEDVDDLMLELKTGSALEKLERLSFGLWEREYHYPHAPVDALRMLQTYCHTRKIEFVCRDLNDLVKPPAVQS